MSTAPGKRLRPAGGFTLLEITLAVAILAMMSLAIYRFVQSNLTALRVSAELTALDAQYTGFLNLLTEQLQNLPTGAGALLGEPLKLNDRSRDEITWVCSSGAGLLTRYAAGEYTVSLRLRPTVKDGDQMEIGVMRKPKTDGSSDAANETWVSLLSNVETLQIRYFDPRLNTWVERWTDTIALPGLVKVIVGRVGTSVPWEATIALRRTPL